MSCVRATLRSTPAAAATSLTDKGTSGKRSTAAIIGSGGVCSFSRKFLKLSVNLFDVAWIETTLLLLLIAAGTNPNEIWAENSKTNMQRIMLKDLLSALQLRVVCRTARW